MSSSQLFLGQILLIFLAILAGIWAGAQYAAIALDHQAALGPAWFHIADHPIYKPWRLFEWWYAYEAYAPEVFNRAGLIAAGGGLLAIAVAILGSLWRARTARRVTTYGSARWARPRDVRKAGLFRSQGVFLGLFAGRYLRHEGPEHVMAIAPTRSGKGIGLVVPTLLSWPHSAVIHDIKGENWTLTAGWRAQFSHCLLFNPTDAQSARYNPLLDVRKGPQEVRDVQNIADILVDPEGALEHRSHWEKTSHALLVGVILHVLYAEADKTLARVAALLSDPVRSFERTLRALLSTNHLGCDDTPKVHPIVAQTARELLNKSDNERSGVLSTAMSYLSLYRDPTVAAVTAASDWRIEDLIAADKPVSLYLVVPPSDISRTKPLVRLILNQIGRRLTETLPCQDAEDRRAVLLMLDEFPALGRLDFFESALAFMAGYGVRSFLISQSLNQIEKAYGPNNAILDNCHVRVAFAANDERTAKRISDGLGTATELRAQRNYAGHRLAPWLAHVMVSRQETARALLTPGEVMQLPGDEQLVLVSGQPPIRATKLRYFEDRNFRSRVLPPPGDAAGVLPTRPAPRPDDWSGRVRKSDDRLSAPWADLVTGDGDGRERVPDREGAAAKTPAPTPDAGLFEPEGDVDAECRLDALSRTSGDAVRRVHGIDQATADDLFPGF